MKKLFMVFIVVIVFFGIVGCPSSDDPSPLGTKNAISTPVTPSESPADPGASPVPEPATLILLGTGLVGLAGIGRKKIFKKD